MPHAQLEPVVRHLRRLARTQCTHDLSDAQLLQRFATHREETAFATLVERHGRLVLGVCRQVLRHEQDAEDAFQATFLVLARHAATIHKSEAVGSWLYRVAYRIAVKAGVDMARQRAREREVGNRLPREAPSEAGWRDLQEVLQEELARLPEKYRAPFVLCCLDGRTGADAAGLLGWKEGTVTGRLTRARKLLQERLARRGIVLAAVLTAAALSTRGVAGEVHATLASATVRAACLYAAGKGAAGATVSAAVAGLVRGASRTTFLTGSRAAVALLLVVGLLTGAGLLTREALAARQPATAQADVAEALLFEEPQQPAPSAPSSKDTAPSVELSGTVLGPDEKPLVGARLYLWTSAVKKHADLAVRATTGADGRFRFAATQGELERRAKIVATAEGSGPDWTDAAPVAKGGEATLRLVKDDVPITGRVLDLEGQPVAGAAVQVYYLEARTEAGDLAPWIETKQKWARGNYVDGVPTKTLAAAALDGTMSATTDNDGRFRLAGFGHERVVHLHIRGKGLETSDIEVLTRPGSLTGVRTGNGGAYAASFDYHIGPSKPITGTVRDKRTGKPLAGMTVAGAASPGGGIGASPEEKAITDDQGKYQLAGIGKCEMYWAAAEGVPYFNTTRLHVKDTGGVEPLVIDFDLERGIAVKGRLTDKATGKPVKGHVTYLAAADNPNLKDYTELTLLHVHAVALGDTGPDGSFTALGIPGSGLLIVKADDVDRYVGAEIPGWDGFLLRAVPGGVHPSQFHAVVPINVSEEDPKSTTVDIALEPGRTRTGKVVGADGEPLAGTHVAGLTPLPHFVTRFPGKPLSKKEGLKTADFTVLGLSPRQARNLVFFHAEKKLGKVQPVKGDEEGMVTVRLEPLGGVTGQVFDAEGRPWAGLKVSASITRKFTDYKDLPWETLENLGPVLTVNQTTDAEGKFRIDGLLPGLKYNLVMSEGELKPGKVVAYHVDDLFPEAGKIKDLGELKSKEVPGKEGKEEE
jgi:RNA polymerase sigma factor (sigma-70 family)